jgi:hypothetical protein
MEAEIERAGGRGKKRLEVRHLFDIPEVTAPVEQALCWRSLDARYRGTGVRVRIRAGFSRTREQLAEADLVLVKWKGRLGAAFRDATVEALKIFEGEAERYRLVATFPGPDGHFIEAYRPIEEK